jgi:hypothetical protein
VKIDSIFHTFPVGTVKFELDNIELTPFENVIEPEIVIFGVNT